MYRKEIVKLGYLHPNVNIIIVHHIGRFTLKNLYSFYTKKMLELEKDAVYYPVGCMTETFCKGNRVQDITDCKVITMNQSKINLYLTKSKMIEYVPDLITKEEYVKEYNALYPDIEKRIRFMLLMQDTGKYCFILLEDKRVLEINENQYYLVGKLNGNDLKELVMMLYEYTQQERKNMIQIRTSDCRDCKFLHIS